MIELEEPIIDKKKKNQEHSHIYAGISNIFLEIFPSWNHFSMDCLNLKTPYLLGMPMALFTFKITDKGVSRVAGDISSMKIIIINENI